VDQSVEIRVGLAQSFNFLDRMENGGVMFAAEDTSDFGKGRLRQVFHQIHRDLARVRNLA